ncbi:MAG: iron-sulfur cluster repair di-iron protein, partial [Actinobacteria bacterium]
MTRIDEHTTLGELVNAHPQLARELERRGLDYCCRGGRTLAEACHAAGLDQRALVTELTALTRRPTVVEDWTTMTATELVDHLVATHHHYLWAELPRLTELVEKVALVHGASHPELRD